MYNYTPIGVYSAKALADEEREEKNEYNNSYSPYYLNEIEIDFVKFLFKIRNANYYGKKNIKNGNNIIEYTRFSGPNSYKKRERVFIAGKIFPILNIAYNGDDADATKISLKTLNFSELRILFGEDDYSIYNITYISIDNDKIKIFLPKSYLNVDFPKVMYDFLTNGKLTSHTIGGEFPDYETYKLALREKAQSLKKWKGEDGCWLKSDRADNGIRWWNGYIYIVKNKVLGRLAPFKQIYSFYDAIDDWIENLGHEVKWCKGAKALVKALGVLDSGFFAIQNDVETILSELNLGICDFAIAKFHELTFGKYSTKPLKGHDAYLWDRDFIEYEQGVVAPPIYNKADKATIKKYQAMADKDSHATFYEGIPQGWHGTGSQVISILEKVIPAFDDFTPNAKVTDNQFRIDLPLLMLYLDKHQINKNKCSPSLKKYLTLDGHINDECKKIIKPYVR